MTLYPPHTDSYPDPYPLTPNVTPGWTPPQPLGPEPASGMNAHLPLPQPRGRGIAVVAMIFSLLALALGLAPFILALRPALLLAYSSRWTGTRYRGDYLRSCRVVART